VPSHQVGRGESVPSIAKQYGFLWEVIWDDPGNAALRQKRPSPFQLVAGDTLVIPNKTLREEELAPNKTHRFVKKSQKIAFKLKLMQMGEARADEPYVLEIDDDIFEGKTDGEGQIDVLIPCDARRGKLKLDEGREEYPVRIGRLDPISELTGVQQRLSNLNFPCGTSDGKLSPRTQAALRRFQQAHRLAVTGEADDATRALLQSLHP